MTRVENKILKEIAEKYSITKEEAEEMVRSQFDFVAEVIKSSVKDNETTFKTVKLPSFGKFTLNQYAMRHIIKNKNKNGVSSNKDTKE